MRVWYVIMAVFIAVVAATAFILGGLDGLQEKHRLMVSLKGDALAAHKASTPTPCPWQLDGITLKTGSEDSGSALPMSPDEEKISCMPAKESVEGLSLRGIPHGRG